MDSSPASPYLVIRGDAAAYWVQTRDDVSATIQALDEGCYRGAVCYDATGGLWPITHAAFAKPPSTLDRLRLSQRLPVHLTFGPRRDAALSEVLELLARVLTGENPSREESDRIAAEWLSQLQSAASPGELIVIARRQL